MTLAELAIGQDARIRSVGGQGALRRHLLDMGLTPGIEVTLRKVAPMGDPIELELRGYELTLRLDDAKQIEIEGVHDTDRAARREERHAPAPPGPRPATRPRPTPATARSARLPATTTIRPATPSPRGSR